MLQTQKDNRARVDIESSNERPELKAPLPIEKTSTQFVDPEIGVQLAPPESQSSH